MEEKRSTRLEKIKQLEDACVTLKSEFIGLDGIIDELKTAIMPWYITPEVIERPVVISLWGMTGTGKTSVIRRLIELLELKSKSLFFDCGEKNSEENSIMDSVRNFIDVDGEKSYEGKDNSLVFVFDEFQYARTLDEHHEEVDKPSLRPIWTIMDNGILYLSRISRFELNYFNEFVEDLTAFAETNPDIKLEKGVVSDKDSVDKILQAMGFFYYSRGVPGMMNACNGYDYSSIEDVEDKDPLRPLKVIEDRIIRTIYRKSGDSEDIYRLLDCSTLGELVYLLGQYKDAMNIPVSLNCSKSLVFVIGNLDEAFDSSDELTPDVDADIFYEETSRVTAADIKTALKERFRPEQIARFGNSLLKYPSFNRESFNKIIRREVDRVCSKFKETEPGIKIKICDDFYDLLYSEGVYPTQGVRPVFTTIGTIFTPILSQILIKLAGKKGEVTLSVEGDGSFKRDSATIKLDYKGLKPDYIKLELTLGKARNPENRKTAYICSVHEIGHAILSSYLTGKSPMSIVSVSTDHGGFCTTFDKDKLGEINSKRDVDVEVMVGVAGYEAEQLVYGSKPDRTLLGSSSDLRESWLSFSNAAYRCGYFEPFLYTNYSIERTDGGPASGLKDDPILNRIHSRFIELRDRTKKILRENQKLLVQSALVLGEKGEISGHEFEELIEKFGNTLTKEEMEKMLNENSSSWYKSVLMELDK